MTYDSLYGKGKSTSGAITLPINSPIPTWSNNNPAVNIDYSTAKAYQVDIAYPYLNNSDNADYMTNVTANNLIISTNLPSGAQGKGSGHTDLFHRGRRETLVCHRNATIDDVIGATSTYTANTGRFTLSVKKGDSADSASAAFW